MSEKTQQQRQPSPTRTTPSETTSTQKEARYQQKEGQQRSVTIRQNFSDESENLINQLINNLLFGCYSCTSMAYYFDREDIGLFGMADFFRWCSRESYQSCRLLMDYIVVRGGQVEFLPVKKPEKTEWGTPLDALEYLIDLKKVINQQVLKVHSQACDQVDPHLTDFLETVILRPLVEFIRKVGVLISNLERAGPKLGEYQFNKDVEKHLQQLIRDVKVSHGQLPVTAVGANVPHFLPNIHGTVLSPSTPLGPAQMVPGVGLSTVAGSTPNFNLSDVINLVSQFGITGRSRYM